MSSASADRQPPGRDTLYHDPRQYDILAQMTAPSDLPFYLGRLDRARPTVLELGCGTGRLSLAIAEAGYSVVGLDRSAEMLRFAEEKAGARPLPLELLRGDMQGFDLSRPFGRIIVPYNAFNHLLALDDVAGCLSSVARHMDGRSLLIIDTFNPDPTKLSLEGSEPVKLLRYIDPLTGRELTLFETTRYDPARQINEIAWSYQDGSGEEVRRDELTMRLFFPQELDALLTLQGFEIVEKLGDYDGAPFGSCSPKQLCLCRRAS